jgi:hypothetical protein
MRLRTVGAVLLLAAVRLPAQSTYDLTGTPDAAIKEPFTRVDGARELPGNRAIVTDQMERTVYLVDFSAGSRRQIGRQGDGPAEYRLPMAPFPGSGGTTWILDATLRRLHVIAPDGSFRPSLTPPYDAVRGGLLAARGVDARGRIYFEGNSFNSETGRFTDSVAVIGWDPSTNATETLGVVSSGGRVAIQRQGSRVSIARSVLPFPHVDAWTTLPDGRVAIVRQSPHTIAFLERGAAPQSSPVLPFTGIPVTPAERTAWRERNSARMVATGGAESRRMEVEDELFPPDMPAFVSTAVMTDATGRIWVGRSHRSSDRTWRYDLYDSKGAHVGVATLPVYSRIVGFGDGVAYVARTDPADDLVYLEGHKLKPGQARR